jgi:hypothetical protein
MNEDNQNKNLLQKISHFEKIEILVNEKQEILFEGIIDPPYINLHFDRIVNSSNDFDVVKLVGYRDKKIKELIVEVFVSK